MDANKIVLGILLGVALFILLRFGSRIAKLLFVRQALRAAFTDVGKQALAKLQDVVSLERDDSHAWTAASMEAIYFAPLRALGFEDAGTYSVDKMPGVHIKMMVQAADRVYVNVYEHPKAGDWVEFVTKYENHSTVSLSTLPPTGVQGPPWLTSIKCTKGTPMAQLYQQLLQQRKKGAMKAITTGSAKHEFEEGYAQYMNWKKNTGIPPEEVARVFLERIKK